MAKQNKFTKSAEGEECTLQLFPYCNQDPETTVLCHLNSDDKGMGIKSPDFFAVYGCSECHNIIDRRRMVEDINDKWIAIYSLEALYRTQKRMIEKGLIKI